MSSLGLPALIAIFVAAAAAVWVAGVRLSDTTDVLSRRFGLGEALGGLLLLAFATNLPEIAITATAALRNDIGVATGNILGGIAIQTLVLVMIDAFGTRGGPPLTHRAASLQLVLEGALVAAVVVVAVMGTQLPRSLEVGPIAPGDLLVAVAWISGVWMVGRARKGLPWHEAGRAPGAQSHASEGAKGRRPVAATPAGKATAVFSVAALVTLAGGVVLEQSGTRIADHVGMSGVLFGSTILAASTALPEVSTGLTAARIGDFRLAVSDIFGGNAFLPALFLMASLLSGAPALPRAQATDIYLAGLGVLLTIVYVWGLLLRPPRRVAGVGPDSLVVAVLYVVGVAGLVAVSGAR